MHLVKTRSSAQCAHPRSRLRAHYAQAGRIMAVSWRMGAVSQGACSAPCCSPSNRIAGTSLPCRRAHARAGAPCRSVWVAVSQPSPVTIQNYIVRQKPCPARARLSCSCTGTYRARTGPCCAWPRAPARSYSGTLGCAQLPCVTIQFVAS